MGFDPSFPFYPNDWLSSPTIDRMSLSEQGAYLRLLLYCWQSQTVAIPNDDDWLADVSRLRGEWSGKSGKLIRTCFVDHPTLPGMITNRKLHEIWSARQEYRKKASEAGKKSGKVRRRQSQKNKTKVPSTDLQRTYEPPSNGMRTESNSSFT